MQCIIGVMQSDGCAMSGDKESKACTLMHGARTISETSGCWNLKQLPLKWEASWKPQLLAALWWGRNVTLDLSFKETSFTVIVVCLFTQFSVRQQVTGRFSFHVSASIIGIQ